MVYKDYDSTGILVKDDWQKVDLAKELHQKMNISEKEYREKQQSILENYKQSLLTKDQIYDTFEFKLRRIKCQIKRRKRTEIKKLTKQMNAEKMHHKHT